MEMNLRFPESEIGYWANRYTERQRENRPHNERTTELINLKTEVHERRRLPHERRIAHN